ncbi:TISB-like protein [Mya arenaria]|uniref:TISB-like protein n=1 Tax=Mya arenaria TaxID=6604 RepID=A0ABY7FDB7_MYAAR|nr:mRNA decay activator protein ZFP36L2-A-like [Mya arenaria]WAR20173.1 TISB-like protein [Mya arenaria]
MSAFATPPFIEIGDYVRQNMLRQQQQQLQQQQQQQQCAERRNTLDAQVNIRNRNFSVGNFTPVPGNTSVIMDNQNGFSEHKKLDRSYSEPCDRLVNNNTNLNNQQQQQQQKQAVNSSRYKTELCRPFEESGHCKYADKCQFAHGMHELKQLNRHPKYKTELCRTFHSKGFCPYGPRCNFVHNDDLSNMNEQNNRMTSQTQQPATQQYFQHISPPSLSQSPPPPVQRPTSINFNSSFNGSLGSSAESSPPSSVGSESPSLSPVFFGEDLLSTGFNMPLNNTLNFDNSTNGNVFNYVPEVAQLDLAPLNIQTTLNNFDLLSQQFSAFLSLDNQNSSGKSLGSALDEWVPRGFTAAPPSPPDSISGESVTSSSSAGTNFSSNNVSTCGSPMDVGKNFRLPVFNHISQ